MTKGLPEGPTEGDTCEEFCFDPERVSRIRPELARVKGLGDLFKVLGDETRARIVFALSREELCVCDIAHLLGMSVPAISYHLRLLRASRLARCRRDGKKVYYSLDDAHVIGLIDQAVSHVLEGSEDYDHRRE